MAEKQTVRAKKFVVVNEDSHFGEEPTEFIRITSISFGAAYEFAYEFAPFTKGHYCEDCGPTRQVYVYDESEGFEPSNCRRGGCVEFDFDGNIINTWKGR